MENRVFITAFLALFLLQSQNSSAHPIDLERIAFIESSNRPHVIGKAGEIGLHQISACVWTDYVKAHPKTLPRAKEALLDPSTNRRVADWYFGRLYAKTKTVRDAIIAYNYGIGNWRKWKRAGGDIKRLPVTTQNYLKKYFRSTK